MSGADFILIINMTVSGLFALAFLGIAVYGKTYISARVFAIGFLFAMLYFAVELAIPSMGDPVFGYMLGFFTFLCTISCLTIGLSYKYGSRVPWILLGLLNVISVLLVYQIYDVARTTLYGMLLYQLPYFLGMMLAVSVILRSRSRLFSDMLMLGLFFFSGVHFLLKPLIALTTGGMGSQPGDYGTTSYAMLVQSMGAGLSVANGLLMLTILTRDLMTDMAMRSETDLLSRLLNRRGFEVRAETAMQRTKRNGQALSLIICDLDHFKAINDAFGHTLGDKVIISFSAQLQEDVAAKGGIVARIGGEEFAIMLPGSTIQSARLFAEKSRQRFSEQTVVGLPDHMRFTASFGVAEMERDDEWSDLFRRADNALYDAKKSGRNCVRLALPLIIDAKVVELRSPSNQLR